MLDELLAELGGDESLDLDPPVLEVARDVLLRDLPDLV
jgi:hypothetical protein